MFIEFFRNTTFSRMAFLAFIVGIGAGVCAVVFHLLIYVFTEFFFGTAAPARFLDVVIDLPWYYRVLVPTFGGLLVGLIVTHEKVEEAQGEGVPEVMEAIALERGRVRPAIAPVKALVSAISIGSGGAAGREGPIIHIGSAIGS